MGRAPGAPGETGNRGRGLRKLGGTQRPGWKWSEVGGLGWRLRERRYGVEGDQGSPGRGGAFSWEGSKSLSPLNRDTLSRPLLSPQGLCRPRGPILWEVGREENAS